MATPRAALLFLFVLATLFLSANVSAILQCGENLAGGTPILKLAAQTNSHGELASQSNYTTEIRCSESTGINVGPTQPFQTVLLKLSDVTNAHAESPAGTNYLSRIQMGDDGTGQILTAIVDASGPPSDNDCDDHDLPNANYVEFVRLSSLTNAHLQSPAYTGTKYDYIVCAAYETSGGAPAPDVLSGTFSLTSTNINQGQVFSVDAITDRLVPIPQYSEIDSLQGLALCNILTPGCVALATSDYDTIKNEFIAFANSTAGNPYAGPLISNTVQMSVFGDDFSGTYNAFTNNWPSNTATSLTPIETQTDPHLTNYSLDTSALAIPQGSYRAIMIDWGAWYTFNSAPNLESDLAGNWDVMDLIVTPGNCGNGVIEPGLGEVCDPPGVNGPASGCPTTPVVLTCNAFCTQCIVGGGSTSGTAGDVYVLKNIDFPNVFNGSDIVANITIENKNMGLAKDPIAEKLLVSIRDSTGKPVPGWDPTTPTASDILNFGGVATQTIPVTIQTASAPFLEEGKTYTLYATVEPYKDTTVPITQDELVVTNNSGFKTFTAIETIQTYAIPDSPWWMSILLFGMIAGWLFISSHKKEN